VVVEVDVIIDDLFEILQAGIVDIVKTFFFEVSEETFHGGIIPEVGMSGHGRRNGIFLDQGMVSMRSILVVLNTMQDQSLSNLLISFGLFECFQYQGQGILSGQFIADDKAIEQIPDNR